MQGDNREYLQRLTAKPPPVDHHPDSRNRSRSKSGGFCLETIRPRTPSYGLPALIENESSLTIFIALFVCWVADSCSTFCSVGFETRRLEKQLVAVKTESRIEKNYRS